MKYVDCFLPGSGHKGQVAVAFIKTVASWHHSLVFGQTD